MSNTSATGGYLAPVPSTPTPLEGQALNRFLQQFVVGITGLSGSVVFQRWQPEPSDQPVFGTDWAAVGVMSRTADVNAYEGHISTGQGTDIIYRNEILNVLISFYGPDADMYASLFREGAQLAQNREVLMANGFGFVESGDAVAVPELVKLRWLYRVDLHFWLRRAVEYTYPVLNLLGATGTIETDEGLSETITVS
jgi:hypothetical protein